MTEYTMWNKPMEEWTKLPCLIVTPEIQREIQEKVNQQSLCNLEKHYQFSRLLKAILQ